MDRARLLAACEAHKSPVTSVDWNQLQGTLVLAASTSARVKLLDAKSLCLPWLEMQAHLSPPFPPLPSTTTFTYVWALDIVVADLDYIMGVFVEHTKEVSQVRWNPNAADEFASVAADGLLKLWDRRVEESVGTLVDPEDGLEALVCCDWHKGQVGGWLGQGDAHSVVPFPFGEDGTPFSGLLSRWYGDGDGYRTGLGACHWGCVWPRECVGHSKPLAAHVHSTGTSQASFQRALLHLAALILAVRLPWWSGAMLGYFSRWVESGEMISIFSDCAHSCLWKQRD